MAAMTSPISTGTAFEFVAQARGLTRSEANRVFNEQHAFEEGDLPDALLRIGFDLADGSGVSNLGGWHAHRMLMSPDAEPDGPLLLPHGGGGGSSTEGEVTMKPGYWLWPLPPPGPLRISCEWPLGAIAVTTARSTAQRCEKPPSRSGVCGRERRDTHKLRLVWASVRQ